MRKDGDSMGRKSQNPKRKQRRNNPARFDIYAAALYWVIRLILLFWDRLVA